MCKAIKAKIEESIHAGVSLHPAYVFMMMVSLVSWVILASATPAGNTLETIGPVYSIKEQDFLEYIKNKLLAMQKSGALKRLQEKQLKRAKKHIERPIPVAGITRTTKPHVFYVNQSIRIDHTITDQKGRIIVMAGTQVNPFDYISMSEDLVFIDGDDPEQVKWAMHMHARYHGHTKAILNKGSPIDLMKKWKQRFYFDQKGVLTKKFHLHHVPAIVSQSGKLLRIQEVVL